jgi:uncharacterized protein (DUF885 family)
LSKSSELRELADEYWEIYESCDPLFATSIGDRKFDDLLPDITSGGRMRSEKQYDSIVQRCNNIRAEELSDSDKPTHTALLFEASSHRDIISIGLDDWTVDPLNGPQVEFLGIESYQPVRNVEEGRAMVKRWMSMGKYLDDLVENLRAGLAQNKVAVRVCVEKVIDEIQDLLAKDDSDLPFLRPLATKHDDWSGVDRNEFHTDLQKAVRELILPAFRRYLDFLRSELLNRARPEDRPGIVHTPGGSEAYATLIKVHTSLNLTPEELHQTGLKEVAKINKEMEDLGEKLFGTRDRKNILLRLRTDQSLYFSNRDEVAEKAEDALKKAKAAIPKWFGRLPRAGCEVVRMEPHEEKHSTIAYYRQPAADGSRPGSYYINTSDPKTRPRYEAEALAYHESIPGHHLQIAIAQELENIPQFRKNSGVTAFIEGWGLYSERLANEMGLYSSDLDKIGMLSYDSWRACRLVVDTGMHAMRWTRQEAIDFMLENTALAKNNIMNEVDRYITRPGQALAYKTGQLEMMRLRQKSRELLGDRFDIRKFHDVLLGSGAVPLEVLRQLMAG